MSRCSPIAEFVVAEVRALAEKSSLEILQHESEFHTDVRIIGVKKFFECSEALPKFESSSLANDSNTGSFSHLLTTFAPLSLRSSSFSNFAHSLNGVTGV